MLIEPGSIQTDWGRTAAEKLRDTSGHGAYQKQARAMAASLEGSSQPGARTTSPPSVIAKAITRASTARRPRTRYRVGFGARPFLTLHALLPDRVFDKLIKRGSGMPA